jgi:hypothetical protein
MVCETQRGLWVSPEANQKSIDNNTHDRVVQLRFSHLYSLAFGRVGHVRSIRPPYHVFI